MTLEERFASARLLSDDALVAPFRGLEGKDCGVSRRELESTRKSDHSCTVHASECRLSKSMPALIGFDEHVFDRAELSVAYLLRTNTWPRYVSHLERTVDGTGFRWPPCVF